MVERHWCKALDCILMVFMYCYYHQFMCVCWLSRRRPQSLVHAITFELLLDFFQFWHDCWPWPIDYLIRFWSIFVVTLTLNFQGQIWHLLYLSHKWFDCHETKSKHIDWTQSLKCDHLGLTLAMTLTLNFQGQIWNLLYLNQKWSEGQV